MIEIMKRLLFTAAAALAVLSGVSCKKDGNQGPTTKPTISWGVENASLVQIGSKENTKVTITAEEGLDTFTAELTLPSIMVASTLNSTVLGIQANWADEKKNAILDFVNDDKCAKYFGLSSVRNSKSAVVDPGILVKALLEGYAAKDGDEFVFSFYVKDAAGQEVRSTYTFHWTAEPSYEWPSGDFTKPLSVNPEDPDAIKATFKIAAPAKIQKFFIVVRSNSDDALDYASSNAKVAITEKSVRLDLIGNALVKRFNFGTVGEALVGLTSVEIDLADFVSDCLLGEGAGTTLSAELEVTDDFDRTTTSPAATFIVAE